MDKQYTFTVENDQGITVNKVELVKWVKSWVYRDLKIQGYKTVFRIRQTSERHIEAYDTKGNVIQYCYGGFDGCEGVEPFDHGNWPKAA